jgi:GNAT superfamily N-acetyltransferase
VTPSVEVTRITGDISDAVAEFYRKVWTDNATPESVRLAFAEAARSNPAVPGADVPAVAYLRDSEVVGYLGTIPVKFWNGREETAGHWLKGFMVLPEYQNGPVGFAVLKEMLKHIDVAGTMSVAPPARRLFKAVGFLECGVIPNYVSLLRAGRVARSIDIANLGLGLPNWLHRSARVAQSAGLAWVTGAMAGMGFRAWRAVRGSSIRMSSDLSGALPSRSALDDLWARARRDIVAGAVRDGTFLSWRYQARAGGVYEAVAVYERANKRNLVAIAVVRRWGDTSDPRLRGIKVATLADILFCPDKPAAGVAALAGAERLARRMGADAILCSASHPAITRALRRRAYLRLPGNVHLMVRDPTGILRLPLAIDVWWVMRGDGNSDGAL